VLGEVDRVLEEVYSPELILYEIWLPKVFMLNEPAVVMAAKTYDVHLSHSGRKIARCQARVKTGTVQM
jgi:hypothetical protein